MHAGLMQLWPTSAYGEAGRSFQSPSAEILFPDYSQTNGQSKEQPSLACRNLYLLRRLHVLGASKLRSFQLLS